MPNATKITGEVVIAKEVGERLKRDISSTHKLKDTIGQYLGKRATELIEVILAGAFYLEASDIHIEPKEENAKMRLRIDGVLHDVMTLDLKVYQTLISRFKLLSRLKLNVASRPQDGRFSIFIEDNSIEVRASTLPSEYGEALVLRVLNPKWVVDLEDLGLRKDLFDIFTDQITKPNGMIISTGPTGSGKTTTLYAFLQKINKPEIKIITIEDPIEYHLKGVSQSQVDTSKGYDFANGLRAIVRQDPDVILVGEIRDLETAQISMQAALTGHLVLSTVHTNDAAGTVARLQALGEKPANIAPAINMAIAQRLVRKICTSCAKQQTIAPELLSQIKKELKGLPNYVEMPQLSATMKLPVAKGCDQCNFTGYKGRSGIFEVFQVDDEMEKFILSMPSIAAMRDRAIERGMVLMRKDGFIKVARGVTTAEEIQRVTEE